MSQLANNPRYQALSAAREKVLTGAAKRVPAATMASQARALGLWGGKEPLVSNDVQFGLLFDLAVFAPVGGHTAAIEREQRATAETATGEQAEVLSAAGHANFTLFHLLSTETAGGVRCVDVLRGTSFVLWDAALEREEFLGCAFAGRLMPIGEVTLTCGATAPVTDEVVQTMLGFPVPEAPPPAMLPALTEPTPEELEGLREQAAKPDFEVRLYKTALNLGLLGPLPRR
ncbi:hypothetical protein EOD42_02710 [Rhodovarius crocodyli]|uniref:Uncharacterized protein n=1 Tax=Rhodovarius crocodyli TaxID=1979269 RepID=A0A437MN25_9PROT|nr:hypothetical protein [Rhodovarius crocodyli]RVT99036.1 hypothetical protein EOD42_02710 [Rhodovarius crocodyli]